MVTLGVALSVALAGLLAAHGDTPLVDEESIHGRRPGATGVLGGDSQRLPGTPRLDGVLQAARRSPARRPRASRLAVLRYGAVGRSTIWEALGSLVVLAIVAAIFALWVGFVHRRSSTPRR